MYSLSLARTKKQKSRYSGNISEAAECLLFSQHQKPLGHYFRLR
nr:MAG TPA_asm: hypothetical protein [Caudoviricetes sp.]